MLADFNLAVVKADRQTAKFNFPPNFPATCVWYFNINDVCTYIHCAKKRMQQMYVFTHT